MENGSGKAKKSPVFSQLTEEQKSVSIPYFVAEGNLERAEQEKKRWMYFSFALLVLIAGMILGFFIYESQFETYSYTTDAQYDSDVSTSVINTGTGTVNYDGFKDSADREGQGEAEQQWQSDENMPDL